MAFEQSATFPAQESDPAFAFLANDLAEISFGQIFNGLPQLYAGSSFEVEEIFEGKIEILRPELIDTDFKWFPPKRYFGTWTVSDTLPGFGISSEDRGYIENEVFKIKRYSTFTIQANADVSIAEHEEGTIDNCNFLLNSVGIEIPPLSGSIQVLEKSEAVFKIRTTLRNVPLIDRPFFPKLRYVGLYISVGSVLTEAKYIARVINGISVDLPPFPPTACTTVPEFDCAGEFTDFLFEQNSFVPNPRLFASFNEALGQANLEGLAVGDYSIIESGKPCSADFSIVTPYWIIVLI